MNQPETIDQAVADRLAKLRAMPVDPSRLAQRLRAEIPAPAGRSNRVLAAIRPLRAVAASVLLVIALTCGFLVWSARPAVASAQMMAQMHEDLVAGRTPVVQVDSIEDASRQLARQARDLPSLPNVPAEHVMACCMKSVKNKAVACVLLKSANDVPITMAVASSDDMRLPPGSPTIQRNGMTYRVESFQKLSMVSTQRQGRWVCLIGAVPAEQLMELAGKLEF